MVTACPKCGYVNNGLDAKCANCSCPLPEKDDAMPRQRIRLGISLQKIVLALVALSAIAFYLWGGGDWTKMDAEEMPLPNGGDAAWQARDNSGAAYLMICDFVRDRCNAPGTAVFPPRTAEGVLVTKAFGTSYEISGYVDSEDSNGVRSTAHYSGVIREVSEANWKLVSLEFKD